MPDKDRATALLRQEAHRQAGIKLSEMAEHETEFEALLTQVLEDPDVMYGERYRVARSALREAHPEDFRKIYDTLKEDMGVPLTPDKTEERELRNAAIVEMYGDGSGPTMKQVGDRYGVSRVVVNRLIHKAGVTPPRGGNRKKKKADGI